MAHTYTDILMHVVFSTKDRMPLLTSDLKPKLFAYMGGICENLKCVPHKINGPDDHLHLLVGMTPTIATSDFLRLLKSNSSKWVNEQQPSDPFDWQTGYAAFSVSHSNQEAVFKYIENQEEHHKKITFKQELLALLKKHGIKYDERYIWK